MKKILAAFIIALFSFSSCQKELAWESETPNGNDTTSTNPNDTYQPVTAGSKWTYRNHQTYTFDESMFAGIPLEELGISIEDLLAMFGMASASFDTTTEYILTSLGTDTTIQGKKFNVFTSNLAGPESQTYFTKEGGNYFQYGTYIDPGSGEVSPNGFIMLYFKDDQPVGSTWEETHTIQGMVQHFKSSIKGKGLSKTVNGITYKDVIEIEVTATPELPAGTPEIPGMPIDLKTVTHGFLAKNIGMIYQESAPGFGVHTKIELLKADIK